MRVTIIDRPHTQYEKRLHKDGYHAIAGVDEVGRGAWAGPIVAGAVIMPPKPRIYGVRDSKALSANRREELSQRIKEHALAWGIGIVQNTEIDDIGIVAANELAMRRAIDHMPIEADYILIDAFKIVGLRAKFTAVAHGDARVYTIAAASIVAKVARDDMMRELHKKHPVYKFDSNKGYGTDAHKTSLERHGTCVVHRHSFHPMKTMI